MYRQKCQMGASEDKGDIQSEVLVASFGNNILQIAFHGFLLQVCPTFLQSVFLILFSGPLGLGIFSILDASFSLFIGPGPPGSLPTFPSTDTV